MTAAPDFPPLEHDARSLAAAARRRAEARLVVARDRVARALLRMAAATADTGTATAAASEAIDEYADRCPDDVDQAVEAMWADA